MSRPELDPRRNLEYPQYKRRGSTVLRTGSGRIWGVRKYSNDRCPCKTCQKTMEPSRNWGRVFLYTATHVVFDNSEGSCAEIKWGYNNEREESIVMEGVGAGVIGDMNRDKCTLTCVTCNVGLVDRLAELVAQYRRHYVTLYNKYCSPGRDDRLTVVVSHPHGRAKAVTFGRWTDRSKFSDQRGLIDTSYTYTTKTCAGSSGAPVYVLGRVWFTLSHSGSGPLGNFSGGGWGVYTN
ncbi:hypothetical protein Btru_017542 [Bulinus truncatus]|nr:hypothetical protein Btru_017542 [Bulinus truncatus]